MSNTEQQGASGVPVTEGYMPFGEYRTYYRIAGDVGEGPGQTARRHSSACTEAPAPHTTTWSFLTR
ncbi:MAG: hypothetical protein LKF00_04225 [Olsenella sp.]|nr:hypothetical protein [Olsenella sp.]